MAARATGSGLCALAMVAVACTGKVGGAFPDAGPRQGPSTQAPPCSAGTLAVHWSLPAAANGLFGQIGYTLTNGVQNTVSGVYVTRGVTSSTFTIDGVSAGSGYALALTTQSYDGSILCSYPAPDVSMVENYTIVGCETATAEAVFQCIDTRDAEAGTPARPVTQAGCPRWDSIVATPYDPAPDGGDGGAASGTGSLGGPPTSPWIADGHQLLLQASASGPNPAALDFLWVTTAGTLTSFGDTTYPGDGGTIQRETIFTCPPPPSPTTTVIITMTVSGGEPPDGAICDPGIAMGSFQVTCVGPPS